MFQPCRMYGVVGRLFERHKANMIESLNEDHNSDPIFIDAGMHITYLEHQIVRLRTQLIAEGYEPAGEL